MPYAALDPDLHALTNPSADRLKTAAHELAPDGLLILDYRLDTLEPLQAFDRLRVLKIQSGFKLREIASVASLTTLRELMLSTPTGSDGSGRVINVPSYAPLASLTALERLRLLGVRPADLDLSSIAAMRQLHELEIGGVKEFTLEHFARLAAALPNARGRTLQPFTHIPGWTPCQRCRGEVVMLNGAPPRARKFLCRTCHANLLAAHVAKWNLAVARSREC
jgi:hypothetical protein